jgi:hypothetical protein
MRRVLAHTTVCCAYIQDFDHEINRLLAQGWELWGNLFAHEKFLFQAMVKYERVTT